MLGTLTNPLDIYESFLENAIKLTYSYVASLPPFILESNFIPSVEAIEKYLPAHFDQELSLMIIEKEAYECIGVKNKKELYMRIKNKEFRCYIPDKKEIIRYLQMLGLSFIEYLEPNEYRVRNFSSVEVW